MSEPYLSEGDAAVLGFPIARVMVETRDDILAGEQFARERGAPLLVARCRAAELSTVHALTDAGHRLMDTQVRFSCRLVAAIRGQGESRYRFRFGTAADAPAVRQLARDAFRGFPSHYHADARLDRDRCDDIYAHWVVETLQAQRPNEAVIVADDDEGVTVFGIVRVRDRVAEAVLGGTRPTLGGSRAFLYGAMIREGIRHAVSLGATRGVTSASAVNFVVQHVLIRGRWMPADTIHTFHRWLDE